MIPVTMRAVEVDAQNQTVRIVERPIPKPGPNQVLVRIAAAPINPSDLGTLRAALTDGSKLIPGREGSGTVVAAGSGFLPRLMVGRRVACGANYGTDGTWAEYLATPASFCVPLRKDVSLEAGSMLLVNPVTAYALIEIIRQGGHKAFASTAAASQLGRMLIGLADQHRLTVVNIVRRQEQVDLLKTMGAAYVLNSTDADFSEQLRSTFADLHVTVALDAIGGAMTSQLLAALPQGGEVITYSSLSGESAGDTTQIREQGKRVSSFLLPTWFSKQGLIKALWVTNQVQKQLATTLRSEVRRRVPLAELPDAIEDYRAHMTEGKTLILMH